MRRARLPTRRTVLGLAAPWWGGCAQLSLVEPGAAVVRQRLEVQVEGRWNRVDRDLPDETPTWTQEGLTLDQLRFYVGVKDGWPLTGSAADMPPGPRPQVFRAGMQAADIVRLFEQLHARDGSAVELRRLAPHTFVGRPGFMFELEWIRRTDDLRLRVSGWGAVTDGELHAITYSAPRLVFHERGIGAVRAMARSARLR